MKRIGRDTSISLALQESALRKNFQSACDILNQVIDWLVIDNFHSIILDVKNNEGKMLFNGEEIKKIHKKGIIKRLTDNNIEIIAGMRVHDCLDERVSGRRSVSFDGAVLPDRVCPISRKNMDYLIKVAKRANEDFGSEHFHFSYYRYKSSQYCFCDSCLSKFAKDSKLSWEHKREIFKEPELFADWILWRATQLINFAAEFKTKIRNSIPKATISIETDLSPLKNYHLGTLIEEGHRLSNFIKAFDKVYYHIEPLQVFFDSSSESQKVYSDKLDILKYVIGKMRSSGLDDSYMFWELNSRSNLDKAIDLANSLDVKDIVLYTREPRSILEMLKRI
jgi:hypothetical protein